jgi:flagellar protein FlaG
MSMNIGGSNLSSGGEKLTAAEVTPAPIKRESSATDSIHNAKDLKSAQLEGVSVPISEEQLIKSIERAIKAAEGKTTTLDFSIHSKTRIIMVKVLDKETGNVIREIPPEKTLDFIAKIWEKVGILVDERR